VQDFEAQSEGVAVQGHWIEGARKVLSPNWDDRPEGVEISLIVIHCISLPPGQFKASTVCDFFCNQLDITEHAYYKKIESLKVSSHLLIERNGGIIQFVPFHKRAWHAGLSEFEGRQRCNDYSIGIELSGAEEVPYTDEQYAVLASTIRALQAHYPATRQSPVVGHSHIAPERKTDPGPAFDWSRLSSKGIKVL